MNWLDNIDNRYAWYGRHYHPIESKSAFKKLFKKLHLNPNHYCFWDKIKPAFYLTYPIHAVKKPRYRDGYGRCKSKSQRKRVMIEFRSKKTAPTPF